MNDHDVQRFIPQSDVDRQLVETANKSLSRLRRVGSLLGYLAVEVRGARVFGNNVANPDKDAAAEQVLERLKAWDGALDRIEDELIKLLAAWQKPVDIAPEDCTVMGLDGARMFGRGDPFPPTTAEAKESFLGTFATLQMYRRLLRLIVQRTVDADQARLLPAGRLEEVICLLDFVSTCFDVLNDEAELVLGGNNRLFPLSRWCRRAPEWRKSSMLDWEDTWSGQPNSGDPQAGS
jgi:hypothetical protein